MAEYVRQGAPLRKSFVPDYGLLLTPPELLAEDFTVEKTMMDGKKTTNVDSWFATVAKPFDASAGSIRSPASSSGRPASPSAPASQNLRKPKTRTKSGKGKKGAKRKAPAAPGASRDAADRERRTRLDGLADDVEWESELLRERGFDPETFVPDIDVTDEGWMDETSDKPALLLWPAVDACGERTLDDILNQETKKVYVSALDGVDARKLREDFLLLLDDDLDRHASVVKYSSKYFQGLADALRALWTNLPVLFRRYGCLEILNQTGVARASRHRRAPAGDVARDVRAPAASFVRSVVRDCSKVTRACCMPSGANTTRRRRRRRVKAPGNM